MALRRDGCVIFLFTFSHPDPSVHLSKCNLLIGLYFKKILELVNKFLYFCNNGAWVERYSDFVFILGAESMKVQKNEKFLTTIITSHEISGL